MSKTSNSPGVPFVTAGSRDDAHCLGIRVPRRFSNRVATSPGCAPLHEMFIRSQAGTSTRWTHLEQEFLAAMWAFDQNFAGGTANQGDNQNGKGDFFTDLICVLLERCSGRPLEFRPAVNGRIFRNHNLDAAYPATGPVEVLIETKIAGAPKSPRNPMQRNALGRPGSADLDKRIKEAGLKTIDLKAEWARIAYKAAVPGATLLRGSAVPNLPATYCSPFERSTRPTSHALSESQTQPIR